MAEKIKVGLERNKFTGKEALHTDNRVPYMVYGDPTYVPEDARPVKVYELNEETLQLARDYPERFAVGIRENGLSKNIVITGSWNTAAGQLKGVANSLPNGPYYADGRDGVLTLHNEKINRPVTKVYTYAGGNGELLEFKVSSKYSTSTVNLASRSEIDPDSKDQENEQTQVVSTQQNGDGNLGWMVDSPNERLVAIDTEKTGVFRFFNGILNKFGSNGKYVIVRKPNEESSGEIKVRRFNRASGKPLKASSSKDGGIRKAASRYGDRRVFNSREDAINYYSDNMVVTEEEVNQYVELLIAKYNQQTGKNIQLSDIDNMSKEEREQYFDENHHLMGVIPFMIKRHITYRKTAYMGESKQVKGGVMYPAEAEQYGNPFLSGESRNVLFNERRQNFDRLNCQSGVLVVESISSPGVEYNPKDPAEGSFASVVYEEDVTIPLDGVKVMGSSTVVSSMIESAWVEQDLLKKTTDAVKANATILGDPMVESSMNIQIQNISSRYSGIWYTKKVTHKFSSGDGYIMDIEFKKRNIPVNIIKIHTRTNTAGKLMTVHDKARKAYESGDYDRLARLQIEIQERKAKYPDYQSLNYQQIGKTNKYNIYKSSTEFNQDKLEQTEDNKTTQGTYVETITLEPQKK